MSLRGKARVPANSRFLAWLTACDDPLRKARSAMNASNVGLFPSSKPVFKIAHALQNTHI
jgi:hypothetical protein